MDDDEQLEVDLLEAKRCIFRSFESIDSLFFLDNEKTKIKTAFDMAFRHKLSNSLIVVGGSDGNSIQLIKSVLASYKNDFFQATSLNADSRFNTAKNYVAKVSGSLQVSDQEALEDLANQFLVRTEKESASSSFLEDLEDHFRQCRLDGIPAIIVIEDFHVFTKKKRQTLIYTLLDLMHRKELLFMIVGLTDHADVETMLEKRVLSRLNTQYVFMSRPTGADICEYLCNVCTLPVENNLENANIWDTAQQPASQTDLSNISAKFVQDFNQSVAKLFGKYVYGSIDSPSDQQQQQGDTLTATTATIASANNSDTITNTSTMDIETEINEVKEDNHKTNRPKRTAFSPGEEWELVSMHCEWGRDLSYFIKVGLMLVCSLSLEQPFLSSVRLREVLAEQEPESVEEVVAGLSSLELHLFIAVLHIHGNAQKGSNSNIANTTGSMLMLVNKVLAVCDMLTEVLKQKIMPKCRIVQALANLAQKGLIFMTNIVPGKHTLPAGALSLGVPGADTNCKDNNSNSLHSITAQSVLVLNVPYAQAVDAFRVKKSRSGESGGGVGELNVGRPRCVVQVTERLRNAVLEPVVTIVYQQSHGQTAAGGARGTTSTLSLSSHQAILDAQKRSFQAYESSS